MEDRIRAHAARADWEYEHADDMGPSAAELSLARSYDPLTRPTPAENLAGLEEEVSALSRKIDTVAATGTDGATMQHLETAIAELRRLSESVASGDAVTKLTDDVREVAEKIDRLDSAVGSMDAVSVLERRLEPFGGSFAEYAALRNGGAAPNGETPANDVSERQEILESVRAERAALEQLESQIARLAEKLEASDDRMAQVGAIERTLADLFMHVEDTRIGAIEAAERAAKAAALEITTAEAGEWAAVEMLQRELVELRETQVENDHRTQQTLESVHDAVQHMIDRMASMDLSRRAEVPPPPPQAAAPVAPSAPSYPVAQRPVAQRPAAEPTLASPLVKPPARPAPPAIPPAPAAERRAIDPTLPADTPLEPGSGAPRVRPGSPAERIAASEAALGPAKPTAPSNDKANFIAAARRAAQAAAADAAATETSGDAESEGQTGGFAQILNKHRRPLLMAVAAIAILAGTVQVVTRYTRMTASTPEVASRTTPSTEAPVTLASDPDLNVATDPSRPPASTPNPTTTPRTDGIAQNIADNPVGSAAMDYVADTTGSLAKPQTTAPLPPPAPAAGPLGPPATTASLDPLKLPTGISPQLRAAATSGDPAAAYEVATRFAEGRDVPMSMEEAVRWFTRAADQGLAPAQYRLGSLYEKGQGVKKDVEAARRLYMLASDKGNAKAMHNLAVLYAEGIDGKADYRTASQWFRKAAERGLADSQYNLGILCARGIGIDRNLAESYKWFTLAAAQGDQDAGRKRDDVAQRLDAQSLAAAKLAAKAFVPEAQPDEAINVKTPPGGWDRAAVTTVPVKPRTAPSRKIGST